jgi:hypothetical protein
MTVKLNQGGRQNVLHLKDVRSNMHLKRGFVLRLIVNLKHRLEPWISQWPVAIIAVHLLLTVVWIAALIWLSVSLIRASVHA